MCVGVCGGGLQPNIHGNLYMSSEEEREEGGGKMLQDMATFREQS